MKDEKQDIITADIERYPTKLIVLKVGHRREVYR